MLIIGEIIKAQGVLGEIKVKPLTSDVNRYKKLRAVSICSALYQILSMRLCGGFVFLRLSGVDNRDKATAMVGKFLEIDRVHAVSVEDDEFFIADLIGCEFFVDGQKRGVVKNILQTGAADIFEIDLIDGTGMMFPFLKRLNLRVDTDQKRVEADSKALEEVSVIN